MRDTLPHVRRLTPQSSLADCIKPCLAIPAYRTAFVQSPFPKAYASIKPGRPLLPVSPAFDFEWTSVVLEHFVEELTSFVTLRDRFYDTMLLDLHAEAAEILDAIESEFGVSLWIIGARIALLQARYGVTAQKEFLESFLNQSGLNILVSMVAFYLSFAAEEHVSKAELDRELDEIAAGEAPQDLLEYFRYHSNPLDLPEKPHVVVALEENAPIVDRFETFVEMAQLQVARTANLSEVPYVGIAVERLASVPDLRIRNLCFIFTQQTKFLESDAAFNETCDQYTQGKYDLVKEQSSAELKTAARKAWWYDLAARAEMKCNSEEGVPADSFLARILAGLQRLRAFAGDIDETVFRIQKLMLLGRRMPSSRYLASVDMTAMPLLVRDDPSLSQWLWILSSPLDNPLHLRQIEALSPGAAALMRTKRTGSATMTISSLALAGEPPLAVSEIPRDRRAQFEGHAALNRHDAAAALDHYLAYRSLTTGPDRLRSLTLVYTAQRSSDRYAEAVSLFAEAYLRESAAARLVPLPDFALWVAQNQAIDRLALDASIVLHAYSTVHDSAHDGDLSDAYENVLDFYEVDRPTALLKDVPELEIAALIYFIRHICTVSRMEDGTGFDEVDDIENERVQLLQWLIGVDPENSSQYIEEIKAITKDQAVASISAHIERSKIYVNEEAVRRSFDAEMRFSFARYRELIGEPNLEIRAEAIEQRIKKLLREAEFELKDLKLPSTERDSLFRSMYLIALQQFLIYPNGGLKTYLSTRILHGALEGEMRSHLARAQLLFPRERSAAVQDFERAWSTRLASLPPEQFNGARDSVLRFSERFSENLLDLINGKVRIRLTTTPNGLLSYDFNEERLQATRQQLASIERYEDFIEILFNDFWSQTDVGLERIKSEIGDVFASKVTALLDVVASSIAEIGDDASDLLNSIVHARTEFAKSVQRASAWFARSGSLPEEPFKLDVAIEAAVRVTNNCFPGREITPDVEGDAAIELPGKWLNPIVDLLCNCFQNVVEHGGLSEPQSVDLLVHPTDEGLSLKIRNKLREDIELDVRRERIEKMLGDAKNGDYHRATEEKGSGFCKIVRIMKYDLPQGGVFDAAVTAEGRVEVSIAIARGIGA